MFHEASSTVISHILCFFFPSSRDSFFKYDKIFLLFIPLAPLHYIEFLIFRNRASDN